MDYNTENRLTYKQRQQLIKIANNTQEIHNNDEAAMFVTLMRVCRDYVSSAFPLLTGEARDKWLIERLKKYRIKYYEKI